VLHHMHVVTVVSSLLMLVLDTFLAAFAGAAKAAAKPAKASGPPPILQHLTTLMEMGFSDLIAKYALAKCRGDLAQVLYST